MEKKEGILVTPAGGSLGYHLLSALIKLEKNCRGLNCLPLSSQILPECPILNFDFFSQSFSEWPLTESQVGTALFLMEDELVNNSSPETARLEANKKFAEHLIKIHKDIHIIFVFPYNTPKEKAEDFLKLQDKCSVFLSPPVVGFRDNSLMDLSLKHRNSPSQFLKKEMSAQFETGFVSSPDLVGFLISAIQNPTSFSKLIYIPEQFKSTDEWVDTFKKYFSRNTPSFKEVLLMPFKKSPLRHIKPEKKKEDWSSEAANALEIFPSPLQSLDRFMKSSFEAYMRSPQNPKHFHARRAL